MNNGKRKLFYTILAIIFIALLAFIIYLNEQLFLKDKLIKKYESSEKNIIYNQNIMKSNLDKNEEKVYKLQEIIDDFPISIRSITLWDGLKDPQDNKFKVKKVDDKFLYETVNKEKLLEIIKYHECSLKDIEYFYNKNSYPIVLNLINCKYLEENDSNTLLLVVKRKDILYPIKNLKLVSSFMYESGVLNAISDLNNDNNLEFWYSGTIYEGDGTDDDCTGDGIKVGEEFNGILVLRYHYPDPCSGNAFEFFK